MWNYARKSEFQTGHGASHKDGSNLFDPPFFRVYFFDLPGQEHALVGLERSVKYVFVFLHPKCHSTPLMGRQMGHYVMVSL